jgi:phosphotransferase system  glucose/maltose/N-acetylglucosamine-specific IIC component
VDNTLVIAGLPVAALIVGLVNALKQCGLPSRWASLAAVGLGVSIYAGWLAVTSALPGEWYVGLLTGVMAGLSASGGYSGTKALRGG